MHRPEAVASDLDDAKEYAEAENYGKAWPIVSRLLNEEPDNPKALCLAAFMLEKQQNPALAYQVLKRVTQQFPNNPTGWLNLGKCCDTLWRMEEAEAAYRRAMNNVKAGDTETKALIHNNLSALFLQLGRFNDARGEAEQALRIDPANLKARHNVGIALLAAGRWKDGWKQYEASVGSPQRPMFKYGEEPTWAGEDRGTVVIYGEQGIGDEISAASMYQDAIDRAEKVVIDCDERLQPLFARSFPKAKVYGTRKAKVLNWDDADHKVDYSISAMQLGAIFRTDASNFNGKPFLTPDPDRVRMWKALWADKKKPVLGIAWTGGVVQNAAKYRIWTNDEIADIVGSVDAHWVCLQYKDATEQLKKFHVEHPNLRIEQYSYGTLTKDYDDMCALVASLDGVVAMQSTAVHTAGAVGVPCAAAIPKTSQWRYGTEGDSMPWYSSVKMFRQKELGKWDLSGIKQWLKQYLSS